MKDLFKSKSFYVDVVVIMKELKIDNEIIEEVKEILN